MNVGEVNAGIKRIFNRHIAKCLDQLGETVAPAQIASIKRSFRFCEKDIVTHVTKGNNNEEENFNR